MDPSKYIRDKDKVLACLRELPDNRLVAARAIKMVVPVRYVEHGLAQIGIETHVAGIVAYIVEDKYYAISLVNAMMRIDPTSTVKVKFNDDEYYEFSFDPGSTVLSTLMLVREDTLVYRIYDEFFGKGRVPWYVGYDDFGKIFDTAKKHANAPIGQNHEVTELMVSIIARNAKDRHQYYRQSIKSEADMKKNPPAYIALRNVTYAATNTMARMAGSYFHEGVVSALNSPSEKSERLESLLIGNKT
jgi:hypothetical protein